MQSVDVQNAYSLKKPRHSAVFIALTMILLTGQQAFAQTPNTPSKPPSTEISAAPGKGITLQAGKAFSLNIRSRIQIRYQLNLPPEDSAGTRKLDQTVNIGTARLWLSGHAFKPELTYMIQLALAGRDYRDKATSPIYDAYLDYKLHRDFSIRAGQFFVPFDRLRTVREFALQMGDRPRPVSELTLDRDVGIVLYSDHFLSDRSPVAFRLGAFGGGGINLSSGKEPGGLFTGRLELRPLGDIDDDSEGDLERRKQPALALGGAVAANFNTNRLRGTTGTTFTGGTTDDLQAAADAVLKWRGIGIQAEYLWKRSSVNEIRSQNADGEPVTEYTRSGRGWVLQLSYVFNPPIEVVGRLSRLYAPAGTDPSFESEVEKKGQELGAGLNYYINGHRFKVQADWIARMPLNFAFAKADHLVHAQVDVTF